MIEKRSFFTFRKGNYVNVCQARSRQAAEDLKLRSEPKKQPQVRMMLYYLEVNTKRVVGWLLSDTTVLVG